MTNFIKTLHKNGNLTWFKFGKSDISDWAASKAPDIFRQFLGCLILTTSTVLIISDCVHWLWCHHRSQIWAENKQTGPTFVWRVKVWGEERYREQARHFSPALIGLCIMNSTPGWDYRCRAVAHWSVWGRTFRENDLDSEWQLRWTLSCRIAILRHGRSTSTHCSCSSAERHSSQFHWEI